MSRHAKPKPKRPEHWLYAFLNTRLVRRVWTQNHGKQRGKAPKQSGQGCWGALGLRFRILGFGVRLRVWGFEVGVGVGLELRT